MEAGSPNLVQLVQKGVVVSYVSHLPFADVVVFQGPVGWRRNNKMDTFRLKKLNASRVASIKVVLSWKLLQFCFYRRDDLCVLSDPREIGLMIGYLTDLLKKEFGGIKRDSQLFSRLNHVVIIESSYTLTWERVANQSNGTGFKN